MTELKSRLYTSITAYNISDIHSELKRFNYSSDQESHICKTITRIMMDSCKFENLSLLEILLLIWNYINSHKHKEELIKRLFEELLDMFETCTTGHLSRLFNVLCGYTEFNTSVINFDQQLRANIFARLSKCISDLTAHDREQITIEMGQSDHDTINDFLFSCDIKPQLKLEFVDSNLISNEVFEQIYQSALKDYFGI